MDMEDYFEIFYTHPDEMIGASRQKQNYAMHRQLSDFERYIQRADNLFSIDRLYRELKCIVPQNQTVNSLQALRQVVHRAPRSTHRRISNIFFKTFFEYVGYLRRLSRVFKERIHTVLFDFFYDTMFIRLQDIEAMGNGAKKGKSSKKGPAEDLSPEAAAEVGELCQQLSCTVDGIEETISSWGKLLEDTEIDPILFDASSEYSISQFKDCKRYQGILRLVPDVLNKSRMAVIFARAWWYKAEKIRRKLGQKSESGSDWSSPDTDLPSVPKTVQKTSKRQEEKTAPKDQPMTQPAVFRRKVKRVNSLEELDAERKELVKPRRGPVRKPANPDGRSEKVLEKPDVGNQGAKQQEEQPGNAESFSKRTIPKKQSKIPSYQAKSDRSLNKKMGGTNPVSNPDESAGPGADEEPKPHILSKQPRKVRPRDQPPTKGTQRNKVKPSPPTLKDHVDDDIDKSDSESVGEEQLVESQTNKAPHILSKQPRKVRPRDQPPTKGTQRNKVKPSPPTLKDHVDDDINKSDSESLGEEQSVESQTNHARTVAKEKKSNRSKQFPEQVSTVRGKKQKQNENQNSGDTMLEDNKNTKQKPLVSHNRNNKKGSNELHGQKQHPGEDVQAKKINRSKDGKNQHPEKNIPTKKINKSKDSSFQARKAKGKVNQPPSTKHELEGEQSDLDNLTWPEKKLEKLRRNFDEAIEGKEIQHSAFQLMVGQKENLVRDFEKYQGYYRHNRILKARVILLIGKAREWKEETMLLDYQCRLLKEDLELEMQLDASFISSDDELQDKIDVLATMVENERVELKQLESELSFMKQATKPRGIPYDSDFDDLLEYGNLKRYGYRYQALGGSLRPSRNLRLLPWNADPFLGKTLQSQYEKSTWRSMDSLSSLGFSYGDVTEDETGGDSGFTRDSDDQDLNFNEKPGVRSKQQAAARGNTEERLEAVADELDYENDSSSDSDDNTKNYPRIYDRKRNDPTFIPV